MHGSSLGVFCCRVKLRSSTLVITFTSGRKLMKRLREFCTTRANVTVVMLLLVTSGFAATSGYHLIKRYKLGGDGGWDYLAFDDASNRIFISRSTHVIVVDADSGKPVGDIPDTPGVHGIALAPEFGRGFVSNGREGTVTIFDLNSLKAVGKIAVGQNPDAILYDPASKRVFTFNGRSNDATAIDAVKGVVVGTIKLDGKPEFAVSDMVGEIFVNIENTSQLV